MSETTAASAPYVLVGPPVQTTRWSEALQQNQRGFNQSVQWKANQAVFTVFVPEGADFAPTVDQLARYQGAQFDSAAHLYR